MHGCVYVCVCVSNGILCITLLPHSEMDRDTSSDYEIMQQVSLASVPSVSCVYVCV